MENIHPSTADVRRHQQLRIRPILTTPPVSHRSMHQRLVYSFLNKLKHGSLKVVDANGEAAFFGLPENETTVVCNVHHPKFFQRVLLQGSVGLGDSYIEQWWDIEGDRLVDFFVLLFALRMEGKIKGGVISRVTAELQRKHANPLTARVAKRDIKRHYDIGNELYHYMLDPSMTYSCGYQIHPDDSLETMQEQKYAHIFKKLGLARGGTLIDLGCGWGGMLRYAAKHSPSLHGIGITLSEEQYRLANERIAEDGLAERIQVQLCDYRDVQGSYDYVVSIGMFEHVGRDSHGSYFAKVKQLLNENGIALLHTINLEEDLSIKSDPWIAKHIFPGSYLPRLEELTNRLRHEGCAIGHIENLRPHYAITLHKWRENFLMHWPEIRKLSNKFDERFFRMWNYYLQISEACFIDSTMNVYQILFSKSNRWTFPLRFSF